MLFLVNKSPLQRFFAFTQIFHRIGRKKHVFNGLKTNVHNDLLKNKVNFVTKDYLIQMTMVGYFLCGGRVL